MKSFFLDNVGGANGWIIDKIGLDIKNAIEEQGYSCRIGGKNEYQGEDVYYHLHYDIAVPVKAAKHNSVFITHIDDKLKEIDLLRMKDKFDSFICMSPEDALFLIELGFDKNKVFGVSLPVRNTYVRPISMGIFSAYYPDDRKNEGWLIEYCKTHEMAQLVNFVFIGTDWGRVVEELGRCKCSSEWHNVSRTLPYEYQFQQNKLANLDYYIYMGMDGGAMGTYDAYAQSVPLCVTFDGFHKSIPNIDYTFDNKESFFQQLDIIIGRQKERLAFFENHTPLNYSKQLINIWIGKEKVTDISEAEKTCITYDSILEKRRNNYFPLSWHRIRRILIRIIMRNK